MVICTNEVSGTSWSDQRKGPQFSVAQGASCHWCPPAAAQLPNACSWASRAQRSHSASDTSGVVEQLSLDGVFRCGVFRGTRNMSTRRRRCLSFDYCCSVWYGLAVLQWRGNTPTSGRTFAEQAASGPLVVPDDRKQHQGKKRQTRSWQVTRWTMAFCSQERSDFVCIRQLSVPSFSVFCCSKGE